jgi:hypothetical protein
MTAPTTTAPATGRNQAFIDDDAAPIPVKYGEPCPCPGAPHAADGDTIFLRAELDLAGGFTFTSAFSDNATDEGGMPIEQALGMAYLVAGISGWTFLDYRRDATGAPMLKAGEPELVPLPASRRNIARLRWTPAVGEIAEVAAKRYGVAALLPLVARAQRSSPRGPTRGARSTSARKASSSRPRKRS